MRKHFFLLTLLTLFTSIITSAQDTAPEMADMMRKDGKIYVVVLVLATIFAGIIFLLIRMDIKIKRLENNNNS